VDLGKVEDRKKSVAEGYDPVEVAESVKSLITDGIKRRYYRLVRGGRWYGGIATADCCGCNLKCKFCWSFFPRDNPNKCGQFYTPEQVDDALVECARRKGYKKIRISGNEPTIAKEHMLKVFECSQKKRIRFILETNGILIDKEYAREIANFKNVSVRISIKGTNMQEFAQLTGAKPEAFLLQLEGLKNLHSAGVDVWPSIMLSFSSRENYEKLKLEIYKIGVELAGDIEEEYVIFYPHVKERLRKAGLKPAIAYQPDNIPREMI
jgi:uncharacterized Fe-S cluster-containing radical SAM superfamily protein